MTAPLTPQERRHRPHAGDDWCRVCVEDARVAAAVAAERERLLGKVAKIAATPGAKAWRDLRALLAAERAGGEGS